MSDRDKFDAWFDKEYPIYGDCGRIKYRESSVRELMIAAWQASRREALEEAATLADLWADGRLQDHGGNALRNCAISIRALAEGDKQ